MLAVPCASGPDVFDYGGIQLFVRVSDAWSQPIPRIVISNGANGWYQVSFMQNSDNLLQTRPFVSLQFAGDHFEEFPVQAGNPSMANMEYFAINNDGVHMLGVVDYRG